MSFEQKNSKHFRIVPLSVSQNTALERLDKDFVSAIPFDYKKVLVITLSMRVLLCALLLLICIVKFNSNKLILAFISKLEIYVYPK